MQHRNSHLALTAGTDQARSTYPATSCPPSYSSSPRFYPDNKGKMSLSNGTVFTEERTLNFGTYGPYALPRNLVIRSRICDVGHTGWI